MQSKVIQVEPSTGLSALANEAQTLFRQAISARSLAGVTPSIRLGYVRESSISDDDVQDFIKATQKSGKDCGSCDCTEAGGCNLCDGSLDDICSIDETVEHCTAMSAFSGVANLLATVKKYEYVALVERTYAPVGNKPFKLDATVDPEPTDAESKGVVTSFYEFLENFLQSNQVKVNEIPEAFDLSTLGEVTESLSNEARDQAHVRLQDSLSKNEQVMERIFQRSKLMGEYIQVMKDTTDYPIGVMWLNDRAIKLQREVLNGRLTHTPKIQCDAQRVDPAYFWATEDHTINRTGRAVFKLEEFSKGDIERWKELDLVESKELTKSIDQFLEQNKHGYRMHEAMLFNDHMELKRGVYDVVITRGLYSASDIKSLGITIPDNYKHDEFIPCEIYFSNSNVLRVRVMELCSDNYGVYTTVFRRRGNSIFGYSLHDFIAPFAKLYESTIDAIDRSMGKSVGSLIQIDTGLISDPEKYLRKDEKTGEVTLDLSEDTLIEFDSTKGFMNPNSKGVPIIIDQLPNNLSSLFPIIDFVFAQLEKVSGIPSILVNSQNISSALRTDSTFNAAFNASAQVVQALLREGERRILKPSVMYIFDSKAMSGDMRDFLIEAEPEILLSDTLTRERNDDDRLLGSLQTLSQFSQLIPQDKLAGLINNVGREVFNLGEDLIPGVGVLDTNRASAAQQI